MLAVTVHILSFCGQNWTSNKWSVVHWCSDIYWTEWGDNARVARKSVSSGSDESILQAANAAGLDQINGLSITNDKLYIGDASGRVYQSNLDGKLAYNH